MQALWILLASLLFATMGLLVKLAAVDYSLVEIVLFRTLPGVLLLLAYARARKLELLPRLWKIHLARNVSGSLSMALGFYAISKLTLATATSLEYTSPLFLMLYLLILARYRPRGIDVTALLGGFLGVVLLLQPSLRDEQIVPFFAGLAGGALAAVAYLQIGRLGRTGESAWRIVLFYSLTGMLASLALLPFTTISTYSFGGLLTLAGIGITGLTAQLAMTRAYSRGSPTRAATLQFSTIAFAAIFGYVLWDDRLSWVGGTGLLLIVASGILAASSARRIIAPTAGPPQT